MSEIVERLLKFHNYINSVSRIQAAIIKSNSTIKLGILGAALISPTSIIDPVASHPDIVIVGIAARSPAKAKAQIHKYKLDKLYGAKVYDTYDELIASPDIDAVYIPLPNGLHAEWTIKALNQGKHVLVEKPMASNVDEVDRIAEATRQSNKVVLEAYHWRFHPSCHRVAELIADNANHGEIKSIKTRMVIPAGSVPVDDIRFNYDLGGGSCMDECYVFSAALCYAAASLTANNSKMDLKSNDKEMFNAPTFEIESAKPRISKRDNRVDESMETQFTISRAASPSTTSPATAATGINDNSTSIKCTTEADLAAPKLLGLIPKFWDSIASVTIEMSKARIEFTGFTAPWLYHTITIQTKKNENDNAWTGSKRTEKAYVGGSHWKEYQKKIKAGSDDDNDDAQDRKEIGEPWWTSYRYQLEAFVNRIRTVDAGANVDDAVEGPWVTLAESRKILEIVDAVYDKAGLPRRGTA